MANFNVGYTTPGGTVGGFVGITAVKITLGQSGILQSLSIFANNSVAHINLGLYNDSGGAPSALVATCAPTPATSTGSPTVNTLPTTTNPTLSPADYWVAEMADSTLNGYYDTSGSVNTGAYNNSQSWGTGVMPSTWPGGGGTGPYQFSLYATFAPTGGGTQSITPTGIASTNAFGTATVGRGVVNVAPTGIVSTNLFGAATIAAGAVNIAPSGIPSANAFGTAVIGRGTVNVAPSGIASTNAFGAATVAAGAVNIAPTGIASTNAFGTATVAIVVPGNISPVGIPSTNAFGTATVGRSTINIAPAGIASTNAFGAATVVAAAANIAPAGIPSANAFGNPTLSTGAVNISPTGIGSTLVFGTAQVLQNVIFPSGIGSVTAFGAVTISVTPPPPVVDVMPPYAGQDQAAQINVNPDIAWRESQPEEGPWVIPPYSAIYPEVPNSQIEETQPAVVPPPLSKTALWDAQQTWPL